MLRVTEMRVLVLLAVPLLLAAALTACADARQSPITPVESVDLPRLTWLGA